MNYKINTLDIHLHIGDILGNGLSSFVEDLSEDGIFKLVQRKAFSLGYTWEASDSNPFGYKDFRKRTDNNNVFLEVSDGKRIMHQHGKTSDAGYIDIGMEFFDIEPIKYVNVLITEDTYLRIREGANEKQSSYHLNALNKLMLDVQ